VKKAGFVERSKRDCALPKSAGEGRRPAMDGECEDVKKKRVGSAASTGSEDGGRPGGILRKSGRERWRKGDCKDTTLNKKVKK